MCVTAAPAARASRRSKRFRRPAERARPTEGVFRWPQPAASGTAAMRVRMSQTPDLIVSDLHVAVEGKEILKGLELEVRRGEIHAIMGPNGSGKSTFANTLMGHPRYEVTAGDIVFKG